MAADAEAINLIEVLMTMIGGNVEHCALPDGCLGNGSPSQSEPPVQSSPPAPGGISATASAAQPAQPPSLAIDGDPATSWISGADAPQWIELDLGEERPITGLRLIVEQFPEGETLHVVSGSGGSAGSELTVLHEFRDQTSTGDVLEVVFEEPVVIRRLRIETTESPSWVAWAEIEVS